MQMFALSGFAGTWMSLESSSRLLESDVELPFEATWTLLKELSGHREASKHRPAMELWLFYGVSWQN